MLLTFFINKIMMSMMEPKATSVSEVDEFNFNYLPGRQRNFEILIWCPYEIYTNLYFEPKKIQNEALDLTLSTHETKENKIQFQEDLSESCKKESISSEGKKHMNDNKKENVRRRSLSVDQFTVLIIFFMIFSYVSYIFFSFFDVLRLDTYFFYGLYRIFTWPIRMIVKLVKKIRPRKKRIMVIVDEPEKLPEVAGL